MFQWFLPDGQSAGLFGWYHILWIGITIALIAGAFFLRKNKDEKFYQKIMLIVGLYLFLFEIFKQIYLITNADGYDWWHAPVQPCSFVMFTIILVAFLKPSKTRSYLESFIVFFGFYFGISAIIMPVTIFSTDSYFLLWQSPQHHALLLATAIYLIANKRVLLNISSWFKAAMVYLGICLLGILVALATHLFSFNNINIMYVSPYSVGFQIPILDAMLGLENLYEQSYILWLLWYLFITTLTSLLVLGVCLLPVWLKNFSSNIKTNCKNKRERNLKKTTK